jgi:hypothetical protein
MDKSKKKKSQTIKDPREEHLFSFSDKYDSFIRFPNIIKKNSLNMINNQDINILTEWSPTRIKEYIFGNNLEGPIRDYLEHVGANEQCVRAKVIFNPNTTICWLCGCKIGKESKACEHIIPALRAIMFSGIITTGEISKRIEETDAKINYLMENIKNNYLWAHANCNSTKGGKVFIKFNKEKNIFEADEIKCANLVSQIVILNGRRDCYQSETRGEKGIYHILITEMENQCISINQEFKEIGKLLGINNDDKITEDKKKVWINTFINYTIDIIKLYSSQEALEKLLTPEEKEIIEKKRKREDEEKQKEAERAKEQLKESIKKVENSIREYYLSTVQFINKQDNYFYIPIFEIIRLKFSYFFYWNPQNNPFKKNKIIPETTLLCENLSSLLEKVIKEISENINSPIKYEFVNLIVFEYLYITGKELGFSMIDTKSSSKDSVILYGTTSETRPKERTKEQKDNDIKKAELLHKKYLCEYLFIFLMKVKEFMYDKMEWNDFKMNYPTIIDTLFSPYLQKVGIIINLQKFYDYLNKEIDVRIQELIEPDSKMNNNEKTLEEIINFETDIDYDIGKDYVEYDILKQRDWLKMRIKNINRTVGKSLVYDYDNLSKQDIDEISNELYEQYKGRFGGKNKTKKRKYSKKSNTNKKRIIDNKDGSHDIRFES